MHGKAKVEKLLLITSQWLCEVGDFGDEIYNRSNFHPNLAKPLVVRGAFITEKINKQILKK